jgi:hypothetical protein
MGLFRRRRPDPPPDLELEAEVSRDTSNGGGEVSAAPDPPPRAPRASAPLPPPHVGAPSVADNTYGIILGQKRMGKTTLLRQLFADRIRRGGTGTFVDSLGINGHGLGGVVVRSPEAWWSQVRKAMSEGRAWNLIYVPPPGVDPGRFWTLVYEVGGQLVAIDEVDRYMSSNSIKPELKNMLGWGGNKRLDVLATTRQLPELHAAAKANADLWYVFRQPDARYAKILSERYLHLADARTIEMLPRFHYLRKEVGEPGVTWGKVHP